MPTWDNIGQVPAAWKSLRGVPLSIEQVRQITAKAIELGGTVRGHVDPNYARARELFISAHVMHNRRWVRKEGTSWPGA